MSSSKTSVYAEQAWKDLYAAFCKFRALVEEGGGTAKMEIKVSQPKKKTEKKRK